MNLLQVAMRISMELVVFTSYFHSINVRCSTQVSKAQNNKSKIAFVVSSIIAELLSHNFTVISCIFLIISLILIQNYLLNYPFKLIVLSNSTLSYLLVYIKMCAKLTMKIIFILVKNIALRTMLFANFLFFLIYYSLFYFVLFKLILKKEDKFNDIIANFNTKNLVFLVVLSILLSTPNVILYRYNLKNNNLLLLASNISTIVLSIFIFLSFLFKEKQYNTIVSDLKQEKMHNKILNDTVDSLRLLKHDYNNILQSINGYIITKQYDSLNAHIKNLINNSKDLSNLECMCPEVINQPAIYGIVNEKYYKAKKKNISFRIEVFEDLKSLSIDSTKLSRILGILLDNAIEAAEKSDNPSVELKFIYNTSSNTHMIKVKNTFEKGKVIDTNKIFEKGESSKETKSGLGLWEVKKLINSEENAYIYANVLEQNKFEQTLIC